MNAHVYRAYNAERVLLYVGSTRYLAQRLRAHMALSLWRSRVADWASDSVASSDARAAEYEAIRVEHPRWNVIGRSIDHPDGYADRLSQIAALFPGDVTRPSAGTDASFAYDLRIRPVLAGLDPDSELVRRRYLAEARSRLTAERADFQYLAA